MAQTNTCTINWNTSVAQVPKVANPLGNYSGSPTLGLSRQITTTNAVNVYANNRTASSADDIDLTSVIDTYGEVLTFASVQCLIIKNNHATASLVIGGATNALNSDSITVKAGNCYCNDSPFTVDGTHKILRITPASAMTYSIIVVGA